MSEPIGIHKFGFEDQPRALFPTLIEPKAYKKDGVERGERKFSCSFLFDTDSPEIPGLKAAAAAVAREKWGDDVDLSTLKMPFFNGAALKKKAEKKNRDGSFYEGQIMLKTASKFPPTLLEARDSGAPTELLDAKKITSGCYVAGEVNFVAYNGDEDEEGNTPPGGVTAYLNIVVFVDKGPRIAGRDAAKDFEGLRGRRSQEDPTGDDDDDQIPF